MSYQDPDRPRQRSPGLDQMPLGSDQSPQRDIARAGNRSNTPLIAAAVIALLAVIGIFIWAGSSGQQAADTPAAQTTGRR
jgi:hypothetical protein